jgi:glycosyltransferase involved in cell wall biosynthesis
MRVVHVVSGRLFGGIEQMLVTIARCRSVTPAIDVQFAVAASGRLEQELRAAGVEVVSLGDVRLSRPASVVHARTRFARCLTSAPSTTVAVFHAPWAFAVFAPVARRKGVPVVLWQHDHATGRTLVERWARTTPADLVICNSVWTSKTAAALQPNAVFRVIHPPVSLPLSSAGRQQIRAGLDAASDSVVILSASRLEPWKGHLHLLRALGQLLDLPRWTLWIAGGAQRPHEVEYEQQLRGEAARLGIESRVRFLGERRDMPALMGAADLFCQANEGPEPFGVVFAEALLSGVPVVTMRLGGAPEIVSDACGRLVPAGDDEALARSIRELVLDDGVRRTLGSNGPAHATARVAPDVVLPQLARAIEALSVSAAA